jgi:hypothetical protein
VRKHQYWDEAAKGLNFRHGEQSRSSSITNSAYATCIFKGGRKRGFYSFWTFKSSDSLIINQLALEF